MEDIATKITFLSKPEIDYGKLSFITEIKDIYVNLFEFYIKKDLKLYKYPFYITPEIDTSMTKMNKIL